MFSVRLDVKRQSSKGGITAFVTVALHSKPGNCPEWLFYCTKTPEFAVVTALKNRNKPIAKKRCHAAPQIGSSALSVQIKAEVSSYQ